MCQKNEVPVLDKGVVTCYRLYTLSDIKSAYNDFPLPEIGVLIQRSAGPFHALQTMGDVERHTEERKRWGARLNGEDDMLIFKCTLGRDIHEGVWSDNHDVKTYTGDALLVHKCVGAVINGEVHWTEEA